MYEIIISWFIEHMPMAGGAVGVSGISTLISKSITDKKQNKKLKEIEDKMLELEDKIKDLNHDQDKNREGDKTLKEMVEKLSDRLETLNKTITDYFIGLASSRN